MVLRPAALLAVAVAAGNAAADVRADAGKSHEDGGADRTIVHDGLLTLDRKEIPGITGGALDANEGEPGTFYIQGDHTGGLRFRNIRISVPKR